MATMKHGSRQWWPWIAGGLAAVFLVIGAGWAIRRDTDRVPEGVDLGDELGVVHVHGLGLNPKDGTLYAATHTGLFHILADGTAQRAADRYQDTMGFTVTGPDRFLASGHPDLEEMRQSHLPPLLGLLESTDAGRTWRPLSLRGLADLHAIRALHGRIYAYNSTAGTLIVSEDRKAWDTRSRIPLHDFVVSPAEPGLLLATGPTGLLRSSDGGRTWELLDAPVLSLLAWETPDTLWGVMLTGAVYRSADVGMTWQQQGALAGPPAALLAADNVLYAALQSGGIYVSRDGGRNWQLHYRDPRLTDTRP